MTATRRGCLEPRKPGRERHRCPVQGVAGKGEMVPPERVCLNSPEEVEALFQALQDFEDQLRPHRYELEELGL